MTADPGSAPGRAARWACAAEALLRLGIYRAALLLVPFRRLAARLGTPGQESPATLDPADASRVRLVAWALAAAARRAPWASTCLVRALAGRAMLHRRGIPSTLTLGLEGASGLQAHAWLRSGDLLVTGGPERERFTAVATFADLPGLRS